MANVSQPAYVGTSAFDRIGNRISARVVADIFHIFDVLLILVAALIAKVAYIDAQFGAGAPLSPYLIAAGICGVIATILFQKAGAGFSPEVNSGPFSPTRLFVLLLFSFMVLLTLGYAFKVSALFSRGWLIIWFFQSLVFLIVNRACYARVQRWLVAHGFVARNIAILGCKKAAELLANTLENVPGVRVVAIFGPTSGLDKVRACSNPGHSSLGKLDDVIIVTTRLRQDAIRNILNEINGLPVQISVCVDPLAYDVPFYGVSRVGQTQLISLRRNKVSHWGHLVKAVEDYVLGSLFMLVALPIFALIAVAIKIDSPGPVFFRQRRHGLNHNIISIYKFRTMNVMEDGIEIKQAKKGDQRVTRVGAFLRKTSLDELPQLFNVLRGEMSLVGPRPHAIAHNNQYGETLKQASYASRHLVKPGITGWAQVNGFRGPTDSPYLMQERVRCDLEYIDNWSIWFDLEILLLTLVHGFVGKNAY